MEPFGFEQLNAIRYPDCISICPFCRFWGWGCTTVPYLLASTCLPGYMYMNMYM